MTEVSIIVPVYNVEKYIKKCIESILNQTFKDFELILVDDGSKDTSGKICDEYQNKDNRIKVYHRVNHGLSESRNFGITVSKGNYICFVDSDDYLRIDAIKKLYETIVKSKVKMVICGCQRVDENGKLLYTDTVIEEGIYKTDDLFKYIIRSNGWYYVTAWNRIYDRKLFDEIRFPKGKISEDMFVVCNLYESSKEIAIIKDRLYFYVQRKNSIMHSKPDIRQLDRVEAYYLTYFYFLEHDYRELLNGTFCQLEMIYFMLRGRIRTITGEEKDRCSQIDGMYQDLIKKNGNGKYRFKCKYPVLYSKWFVLKKDVGKIICRIYRRTKVEMMKDYKEKISELSSDFSKISLAIVMPQYLPVPAVNGGAIETLASLFLEENEKKGEIEVDLYSIYNKYAERQALQYCKSNVIYIKKDFSIFDKVSHLIRFLLKKTIDKTIISNDYYYKVYKECEKRNYDFIITEGGNAELFRRFSNRFGKDKMILHIHFHYLCNNMLENLFGATISTSEFINDAWIKSSNDLEQKNFVVKNVVDEERFNKVMNLDEKRRIRKQLNYSDDDFIIIYCGRIIDVKGVKELVNAVNKIENRRIKLLIVGSAGFNNQDRLTEYEKEIMELAKRNPDRIRIMGYIDNKELYKYYQIADIQAVPSIWEEAAGLVTIEGMYSGLPLIITDSGGMIEYVNEKCAFVIKRTGLLEEDMIGAVEGLFKDSELRKRMSEEARKNAELYTKQKYYEEYVGVLRKLIELRNKSNEMAVKK